MRGSTDVLEHILSHEECDVDPINKLEKATPLHLAMRVEDPELRDYIVSNLLEAGADITYVDRPIVAIIINYIWWIIGSETRTEKQQLT
jgi:hypothetical protein